MNENLSRIRNTIAMMERIRKSVVGMDKLLASDKQSALNKIDDLLEDARREYQVCKDLEDKKDLKNITAKQEAVEYFDRLHQSCLQIVKDLETEAITSSMSMLDQLTRKEKTNSGFRSSKEISKAEQRVVRTGLWGRRSY